MPKIAEITKIGDHAALILEPFDDDEGSVHIWSEAEAAHQRKLERYRCADFAEEYQNAQIGAEDTWAAGFAFAKRMIAQNLRELSD